MSPHVLALAIGGCIAGACAQAATLFTDAAAFSAAAGSTTFDDFESSIFDGTTITFSGGTITCGGGSFCDTFYGNEFGGGLALSGSKAPFFGTPDTLTFSFAAPIAAFGIFIGGSGDVGAQSLSITLSDGTMFEPFPDYTNGSGTFVDNTLFFGVVSATPFTSVSFTGRDIGDGVFFDDLSYRTDGGIAVPGPASALLFGAGLLGLALTRCRAAWPPTGARSAG